MKRLFFGSFGLFLALAWIGVVASRTQTLQARRETQKLDSTVLRARAGPGGQQPGRKVEAIIGQLPPANTHPIGNQRDRPRKRLWDARLLSSLTAASSGDAFRFELVAGEFASGKLRTIQRVGGEVIYISGALEQPESGRFFFQKQTRPGFAGDFVGVVEFPASQRAFRIEPTGPAGQSELIERPLSEVVCLGLRRTTMAEPPVSKRTQSPNQTPLAMPPIPAYQNGVIPLESLPGAAAVIYLDFQGGYTPTWGGVTYAPPDVSNDQIEEVFQRVAEDFVPFNINVTTDALVYRDAPQGARQRVIITPTSFTQAFAGIAYFGSFNWTGDNPCWSFYVSGKECAEVCSHELGHTLGLSHQGQEINGNHFEYYAGQGNGETGWTPIMGVGFYQNVSQWSKGEYQWANNHEDALSIIATRNNQVTYSSDDTGDNLATSRYLELYSNSTASAQGAIERTADTDAFQFTTSGGSVSLEAHPTGVGPNLALQVALYDSQDVFLAGNSPQDTLWASLSTNLPPGTYTFRVSGVGRNDPRTNGFSSYDSLGVYSITGSVAGARAPDRFTIPEHVPNGTIVGTLAEANPNQHELAFTIVSAKPSNILELDESGTLFVAQSSLLDYQALRANSRLPAQIELLVNVTDFVDGSLNETNRRVVIAVTPVATPPIIVSQPGDVSVPAGTNAWLSVSTSGTRPMDYQWFFADVPLGGAQDSLLYFTNVQPANQGAYFVAISNSAGYATSRVATLSVLPLPPYISSQPASTTALIASKASFSVAATGVEPLSFQWQFESADLPGETNSLLVLTNLTFANAGDYRALVLSSAGTSTSAVARLTCMGVAPVVLSQSTNTQVFLGSPAHLRVEAGGTKPISYQWRFDGEEVAGATNALLEVPSVRAPQVGEYSVVLSNAYGVVSSAKARLTFAQVVAWGDYNSFTNVPTGLSHIVRVACGPYHRLALNRQGLVTSWIVNTANGNNLGQSIVPSGLSNVVDIAAGNYHSLALRSDGTVVAWGAGSAGGLPNFNYGQSSVPAGLRNVVAIAAGLYHSVALQADGRAVVWGNYSAALTNVPPTAANLISIDSSYSYIVGLRSDGSAVTWGSISVLRPLSNLVAVAAGPANYLGLVKDGTVLSSSINFPLSSTGVVQIAVPNRYQGLAVKPDGTVVVWPANVTTGLASVPQGLTNVIGVACSPFSSVPMAFALVGDGSATILTQPTDRTAYRGGQTRFAVNAAGRPPLTFQWQLGGTNIPDATNAWLSLPNVQTSDTGDYSVLVSNAAGIVSSRDAHFTVMTPIGESLDAPSFRWTSSGDASWYGQSRISHDGVGAAQSGPINDSQKTSIQTSISGPGWLTFWWKVSSEQWFDFLTFTMDGNRQGAVSGEVDWQQEFFEIPSGVHVLNWTYSKDASGSGGLDAGWVDQVAFGPGSPIITQQPLSQTVNAGANLNLSASASGAPPLAYQWLKNGSNVSGATLPLLSIQKATRRDSGSYAVIVSNSLGTNYSTNALLLVRVPERLNYPQWLPNGPFSFVAADSDNGPLLAGDLAGFTAQISTNLIDWELLNHPLSFTNGTILLIDPEATNDNVRFYRLLER